MKARMFAGLIAAASIVGFANVADASPVAMASNMVGKPTFRSGGGSWKPLGVLQRLSPGDQVKCGPGEQAIIMMFTDGIRFKVASGATGTVQPTAVKGASAVGGMGGSTIRVAKAMTGLDTQPFLARAVKEPQELVLHNYGIIVQGTTSIDLNAPDPDAASYQLTLFNDMGNVIWSTHSMTSTVTLPADLPVAAHKSYVWTLTEFGQIGKAQKILRWGMVTFMSQADADKVNADAAAIAAQATADDPSTAVLLAAEAYRQAGVYQGAIVEMDTLKAGMNTPPGIDSAEADLCNQVSPYAGLLFQLNQKSRNSQDSATAHNIP